MGIPHDNPFVRMHTPHPRLDDDSGIGIGRIGTGGDEAAIFAGDLFRMYARYAE
jgi:protein subunit release factor A